MTSGRAQKIAISVPRAVFRELERKRRALKRTRSALVTEALRQYLSQGALSEEELRYVRGYLREPEDEREAAAIAEASSWGEWNEAE